jgi:hypothetical protein
VHDKVRALGLVRVVGHAGESISTVEDLGGERICP